MRDVLVVGAVGTVFTRHLQRGGARGCCRRIRAGDHRDMMTS